MKTTSLSNAVRYALLATPLALTGLTAAHAAQTEEAKVERIEVTGSRIKQIDMETSSPVTVITAADIQLSGEATVADVLNNTSVNSFGSWRGMSGYGAGASATSSVQMRGLESYYTLVLLDGRRMPGTSSSAGASADTSRIPMAIVERIEILREGASAVYGSDAVAGVINIITKKDFDGVALSYDTERPSEEGGDSNRFSVTSGFTSNKGNLMLTFEHYKTDAVMDRDIWAMDDATYGDYSGFSSVPNGVRPNGSWYFNDDMCGTVENTVVLGDGAQCGYNHGMVTKLFGDVEQNSLLSSFNYALTDDIQFRGRASASFAKTDSRYAGTPVSTNYPVMAADNPLNPVGEALSLRMRSAQIGARDTRTEISNIDFFGGLVGFLDVANGIDWEVNAQMSRSKTNSFNFNLVNDDIVQTLVDSGEYDIFNTTGMSISDWDAMMAGFYGKAAHTGLYSAEYESEQIDAVVSTLLFENELVTVAGVVGAEFETVDFTQQSDPQSASGRVSGGSGGDDVFATRDRTSMYAELQFALPGNIDINTALRYDEYDQSGDVGASFVSGKFDNVAPQVGVAWRPLDSLLVRASWGESFRAPNMGEMFSTQALSFEKAYDTLWCDTQGNAGADAVYCNPNGSQQHRTWFGGNPDLKPEDGESLTLGAVWNITDDWSAEVSYYKVKLDNKIGSISVARLLSEEQDLGAGNHPAIIRDDSGKIETIYSFDQNIAGLTTSGYDFKTAYKLATNYGDFTFKGELTYVKDYVSQSAPDAEAIDYAGLQDYPDLRGNLGVSWSQNKWGAAWTTYYIGDQASGNDVWGTNYLADIPSYVKHNVQLSYSHDYNGSITLGLNNAFDKASPTWYDGFVGYRDVYTGLYDVLGRTVFLRIEQKF
ncbi:TonB-dependent receptor [Rheinheimera sp. FR7-31]|uniref:TonB-dependent receptor n=1 Tax=Rheinheimera fenheensis TaxID=3152295 RepID=UPI00325E06D0